MFKKKKKKLALPMNYYIPSAWLLLLYCTDEKRKEGNGLGTSPAPLHAPGGRKSPFLHTSLY